MSRSCRAEEDGDGNRGSSTASWWKLEPGVRAYVVVVASAAAVCDTKDGTPARSLGMHTPLRT